MADYNRKELILQTLRDNDRYVTVDFLCKTLYVSGATIRRDLTELASSNLIRRTRGGAVLLEGSGGDDPLAMRETQNSMKKQIIASTAIRQVKDGMTLFLDSSSTVLQLAKRLDSFSKLTVITNGLKTALLLSDFKNVSVMCTGGSLRENSKSLIGSSTVQYLDRFTADIAFMSCRGASIERGASEANEDEYYVKLKFLENSRKAILLIDTSKFDQDYICRIAPLARFDAVITESAEYNEKCLALKQGAPQESLV